MPLFAVGSRQQEADLFGRSARLQRQRPASLASAELRGRAGRGECVCLAPQVLKVPVPFEAERVLRACRRRLTSIAAVLLATFGHRIARNQLATRIEGGSEADSTNAQGSSGKQ